MRLIIFFYLFYRLAICSKVPLFYRGEVNPKEYIGSNEEIPNYLRHLYNITSDDDDNSQV